MLGPRPDHRTAEPPPDHGPLDEEPGEPLIYNLVRSRPTSILRCLRRTLEEIIGAIGNVEAGPTVEDECPTQRNAYESGRAYYNETTRLPLDSKIVADAVKDVHA